MELRSDVVSGTVHGFFATKVSRSDSVFLTSNRPAFCVEQTLPMKMEERVFGKNNDQVSLYLHKCSLVVTGLVEATLSLPTVHKITFCLPVVQQP